MAATRTVRGYSAPLVGGPDARRGSVATVVVVATADLFSFLPKFETVAEERRHRQERLAAGFRLFGAFGFDEGVAGHITARDPERPDHFWVNPFGMDFGRIRVSDLLLVDAAGTVVEGDTGVNRAAFAIHSSVHAARPDVVAAAHAHSMFGKTWATLGRLLDPLTQDSCAFFEDHSLFDDYTGVVVDPAEGRRIALALAEHKALILRNHGLLTVGGSVDEAVWWFISLERTCQAQLLAEAAGDPRPIDGEMARRTARPGRRADYRLPVVPVALRAHRPRAARPARLIGRARIRGHPPPLPMHRSPRSTRTPWGASPHPTLSVPRDDSPSAVLLHEEHRGPAGGLIVQQRRDPAPIRRREPALCDHRR